MIPNSEMITDETQVDQRDYCVSDKKLRTKIGCSHKYKISDEIEEIRLAIINEKNIKTINPRNIIIILTSGNIKKKL